ncbi:hypothetical protein HanRHA438_Chr13g0606641 [Helianthus annuus]|uniref:Uncharacterized protein n=1 Tax=Helianthus annuus TaxID=4232 RepID=A0A251SUB5_HELAN|nr:hypothetical protein HanXRQr2_Chr13g0595941 [Helianthus annuus]KAJ0477465.1 hypothetical protein HanHA300_Chr13g0488881 [Helianthus annuus]KAJ0481933.1 hypothetical protein HanIR_Chr13g0648331 [Helianthus annuus]KAJ0498295.1 hypothetical protein HanHA89_Chr13g0521001 [Helianthus annuus]KAJ0664304.1 hypothetical protein HanLR1_Chr13g0490921 [Helianthus annuus]
MPAIFLARHTPPSLISRLTSRIRPLEPINRPAAGGSVARSTCKQPPFLVR